MTIKERIIYAMGYSKGYMKGVDFAIKHSTQFKKNEEKKNELAECVKDGVAHVAEKVAEAKMKLTDIVKTNFKREDSKKTIRVNWIDAD